MSAVLIERFDISPMPNGALRLGLLLSSGSHISFITTHDPGIELLADLLVRYDGHLEEVKARFAAKQKIDIAHGHPGEPSIPNPAPDAPKQTTA